MKRLTLVLCLLVLPVICLAGSIQKMQHSVLSLYSAAGGGGDPLSTVTFETGQGFPDATSEDVDLYNGGSGYNGWIVSTSSEVLVTHDVYSAGAQSICQRSNAGAALYLTKTITSQSSPFWLDYYTYASSASSDNASSLTVGNGGASTSTAGPWLQINGNAFQYYTGSWSDICTSCISNSTWYHIQVYVMPSGSNCLFDVWIDGTEYNNSGNHWGCVTDQASFDTVGKDLYTSAGAVDLCFDDVQVYTGSRR